MQHAADLIEAEHRGLTWEKVDLIRRSQRSALALARELAVSDTLVRKVRRGELWSGAPGKRNRNDVPGRVILDTLMLTGVRVSELSGIDAAHVVVRRPPASAARGHHDRRRRAHRPVVPTLRERLAEHHMDHPGHSSGPASRLATALASSPTMSARASWPPSYGAPTSC